MRDEQKEPLQGRVPEVPSGGTNSRPSFNDPVAGNIDPTAPDSPEETIGTERLNPRRREDGEPG